MIGKVHTDRAVLSIGNFDATSGSGSLKIGYLVNRYPAVSHSFIRREVAALRAAGHEVATFSIRAPTGALPDPRDRDEAARTETVLGRNKARLLGALVGTAVRYPRRFAAALRLVMRAWLDDPRHGWRHVAYLAEASWLARRLAGFDHVHAHFGTNPAAVARLVHQLSGLPYSFTVHGPDEFDAPVSLDLRGKIADARFVAAVSSFGRSQLMRWSNPEDWRKIEIVRCGVDELFLAPPPPHPPPGPTLCAVARLSAQKGLPLLIEAASMLAHRGVDFRLVLVGDGELRSSIEARIARLGLSAQVTITGYVDSAEVRDILLRSRAMVLPSFAEGLPVVIMEALALRTPVIVSAIAGTPELVDAACGWLVAAGSVEALADKMAEALAASTERLAAMGDIGRARVLSLHDANRNGAALGARFAAG